MKKERNKVRTDLGITLIALVITVIVLLILAGVSLKLIAGGDGIIGKAEKAVTNHHNAKIKEELELLVAEVRIEYFSDTKNRTNTDFIKYFQDYITQNNLSNIVLNENGDCTFTSSSGMTKTFTIGKDGVVKEKEKGIALDKTKITIERGNTENIQANLIGLTGKIMFESADANIATVDENGIVTAVDKGKTIITVKVEGTNYEATCEVTVSVPEKLIGLEVDETIEVVVGQPKQLKIRPIPEGAKLGELEFEVSGCGASVDELGFVTATQRGEGRITIRDKNNPSISASCVLAVTHSIREIEIGREAFDQNESTYFEIIPTQNYEFLIAKLPINASDYGKNININLETRYGNAPDQHNTIYFYDSEGRKIKNIGGGFAYPRRI